MKLDSFSIYRFNSPPIKQVTLTIPKGSIFRSVNLTPEGIVAWYEVPELEVEGTEKETFYIPKTKESLPDAEFVTILDTVVVMDNREQALIMFPIYRKKNLLTIAS